MPPGRCSRTSPNPFYWAVAQAVETAARERGMMLITASCEEDPERERAMVTALLRRRVDALLAYGHERIAHVSDAGALWTAAERLAGYRLAHAAAGVAIDESLVRPGTYRAEEAEAVVCEPLSRPAGQRPTAIFTANNRNTVGALRAQRRTGVRAAHLGFDDFELADLLGVTVVRFEPARSAGRPPRWPSRGSTAKMPPQSVVVETEL